MNSKTALEKKYEIIKQNLGNQTTFCTDEVIPLFPELKKSTLYWNLSKLVEAGYIKRVRNGVFSFNDLKGRQGIILCETAQKLKNYMDELGFYYYISGLDILAKYMLHIPEQYPVIAFIEKAAKEEIYNNLLAEGFEVIEPQYTKKMYEDAMFSGSHNMQVILYTTEDFQYSSEGLASIEKAFADLYFAITRNGYPLSLQELVRIYQNLSRLGNIDKKKLITVASRRNIQYDIRFIVENRFITDSAIEFGKILRREE